jgi:hypothetical protein
VWQGPNAVAFSEVNTQQAPGSALETWHETTMAAIAVLCLKQGERLLGSRGGDRDTETDTDRNRNRDRDRDRESGDAERTLLVLGAGQLSAVMNFIRTHHHHPCRIVMVEEDISLAERAMRLLHHPATHLKRCASVDMDIVSAASLQGGGEDTDQWLHIASYSDFVACWHSSLVNAHPSACLFDAILVRHTAATLHKQYLLRLLQPWGMVVLATGDHPSRFTLKMTTSEGAPSSSSLLCHASYVLEEMRERGERGGVEPPADKVVLTLLTIDSKADVDSSEVLTSPVPLSVSLWDQLFVAREEGVSSQDTFSLCPEAVSQLPLSMDVKTAQLTAAVRLEQIITPDEAKQIHAIAGRTPEGGRDWTSQSAVKLGCEIRSQQSKLWEVLFLHSHGAIMSQMPAFIDRVVERVVALDRSQHWGFQLATGNFSLRACEYHSQVAPSEALADIHHYDQDSLVTVDIMLSDPAVEFSGASIQTLRADGEMESHSVQQYDALCFVSHKYHSVTPLRAGRRVVCVLEFWRGSPVARWVNDSHTLNASLCVCLFVSVSVSVCMSLSVCPCLSDFFLSENICGQLYSI